MRHACMVVAAVAATLATACKKDAAGPVGPLNGHWQGAGSGFTMDYTLKDDDSGLSGGGTVYGPVSRGSPPSIFAAITSFKFAPRSSALNAGTSFAMKSANLADTSAIRCLKRSFTAVC